MYIVQELQTSGNTVAFLPAIQKQIKEEAESAYHTIMSAAAVSNVPVHTCIIYDEHGNDCTPGRKYYEHIPTPEPTE